MIHFLDSQLASSTRPTESHAVRNFGWGCLGALVIVCILAATAALDEPEMAHQVAADVDFAAGVEEGRRQEREQRLASVRSAYQNGLSDADERCARAKP